MAEIAIDKSDFDDWMKNPVTKYIFDDFKARCDEYEQQLLRDRSFTTPAYNHFQVFACEAYRKGLLTAYHQLLSLKFNDINEDEELKGVESETSPS